MKKKIQKLLFHRIKCMKSKTLAHTKFGMKKILMMENAGSGVADFIIKRFKNKQVSKLKILAICGIW